MSGRGFFREGQTSGERQRAAAARRRNAFTSPFSCGDGSQYVDVENRLCRVKEMDADTLRAVIALPGCQKSVVVAAERRLRKLERLAQDAVAAKNCGSCGKRREGEFSCDDKNSDHCKWVPREAVV